MELAFICCEQAEGLFKNLDSKAKGPPTLRSGEGEAPAQEQRKGAGTGSPGETGNQQQGEL